MQRGSNEAPGAEIVDLFPPELIAFAELSQAGRDSLEPKPLFDDSYIESDLDHVAAVCQNVSSAPGFHLLRRS